MQDNEVIIIDPGLRNMGWGLIDVNSRIAHVANGIYRSKGIDLSENCIPYSSSWKIFLRILNPMLLHRNNVCQ